MRPNLSFEALGKVLTEAEALVNDIVLANAEAEAETIASQEDQTIQSLSESYYMDRLKIENAGKPFNLGLEKGDFQKLVDAV